MSSCRWVNVKSIQVGDCQRPAWFILTSEGESSVGISTVSAQSVAPASLNKHRVTTAGTCHTWKSTILWLIPFHTMANL